MRVFDLDGVLLPYDGYTTNCRLNGDLLHTITNDGVRQIGIATNQGGIAMGMMGWKRKGLTDKQGNPIELVYPTVDLFLRRLEYVTTELGRHYGIDVVAVRVSLYHPKTEGMSIVQDVACLIEDTAKVQTTIADWKVCTDEGCRKPAPGMLLSLGATVFYGDSDEDEQAAQAAGIPFIAVKRFV